MSHAHGHAPAPRRRPRGREAGAAPAPPHPASGFAVSAVPAAIPRYNAADDPSCPLARTPAFKQRLAASTARSAAELVALRNPLRAFAPPPAGGNPTAAARRPRPEAWRPGPAAGVAAPEECAGWSGTSFAFMGDAASVAMYDSRGRLFDEQDEGDSPGQDASAAAAPAAAGSTALAGGTGHARNAPADAAQAALLRDASQLALLRDEYVSRLGRAASEYRATVGSQLAVEAREALCCEIDLVRQVGGGTVSPIMWPDSVALLECPAV